MFSRHAPSAARPSLHKFVILPYIFHHKNLLNGIIQRTFTMAKTATETLNTDMIIQVNDYLITWIEGFLIDRKARGLTENTLLFYTRKLRQFHEFSEGQAVTRVSQIDANLIRQFLLWLETTGHNPGGVL